MSLPFEIAERQDEIRRVVSEAGAELLEIQFRRNGSRGVLTFVIDKPEGVSLDECVDVNRRLGAWLDNLGDFFQGSYFLEVNSPGLDRPLKTEREFARAKGETVHLVYRDAEGRSRDFIGTIDDVGPERLRLSKGSGEKTLEVGYDAVIKATRQIQFGKR